MSTDRPATTDPAEVAPVHTGGNAEDCPACDGRSDLPYPWICPGKDLTASGREFAVRASEAPGDAQSPTPDVGAVWGGGDGSAAESEPLPMPDPDSPGERMLTAARTVTAQALRAEGIWYSDESTNRITARILARLIPLIRAQVADEIAAHFTQERAQVADAEPVTLGGVHEQAKLLGRYDRVIATIDRIARGDQ